MSTYLQGVFVGHKVGSFGLRLGDLLQKGVKEFYSQISFLLH